MKGRQSLKMQFIGDLGQSDTAPAHALEFLDPAVVDHSKSLEYSTPALITFTNRSSTAVDIYWIDYSGARKLKESTLAVGESWKTHTFVTHPWLVVASGTGGTEQPNTGLRLAGFQMSDSGGGEAIVTDRK